MSDNDDREPDEDDKDIFVLAKELAETAEAAEALINEAPPSAALVPTEGQVPAVQMKQALAARRSDIARMRADVQQRAQALEAAMRDQIAEAKRVLAPLQEQMARLEEGIWTANLYLGRDEDIVVLAQGEPAPAETPITIRQMVLSMDQESMVAAERGGIDARTIAQFDEWITADPAHLEQVLPEPKGVVVLVPRIKNDRDYGDPWVQAQMEKANHHSYWLIRNGDQLYRMSTNFKVGSNLIPTRDEFTSFFEHKRYNFKAGEYETIQLQPGDPQWEDAEKAADARQRHFMRAALILQGLIDRTEVFHPLPAPQVSLLHPESYDAGYIRVVSDAELALGTGRKPFYEWLSDLNAQLRPGMRIVGAFDTESWRSTSREDSEYGFKRIRPDGARGLKSGEIYRIEGRESYGGLTYLLIRFKRTDKYWKRQWIDTRPGWGYYGHVESEYTTRGTALIHPDDRCIIPFDLVTIPEMEEYIAARTERHAYVDMIPTLKAAIAAKQDEIDQEAPLRLLLAGVIAKETGKPIPDVEAALPELVDWWKLANRWHRPLLTDNEHVPRVLRMITDEYRRRTEADAKGAAQAEAERAMVDNLQRAVPGAILIARKRDGAYVCLEPQDDGRVFVRRHTWSSTGRTKKTDEWIIPGGARLRWRELWSAPPWDEWDHKATLSEHLTGPEVEQVLNQLRAEPAEGEIPLAITRHTEKPKFSLFAYIHEAPIVPQHLLTTDYAGTIDVKKYDATWSRGQGMKLVVNVSKGWGGGPWRPSRRDLPWTVDRVHREIWRDEKAFADATALGDEIRATNKLITALGERSQRAISSVARAWEARAEQRAYERFLEDYMDPDLWEGHRKTLTFNFPHWRTRSWMHNDRDSTEGIEALTDRLVERGVQFDGMTVAEALVLCKEVSGVDVTVPDDILDLRFGNTEPEEEPDEEEDDDEG